MSNQPYFDTIRIFKTSIPVNLNKRIFLLILIYLPHWINAQVYFVEPTIIQLEELEEKYPQEISVIINDMNYFSNRVKEICSRFDLELKQIKSNEIKLIDVQVEDENKLYWKVVLRSGGRTPLLLTPDNFALIPNYYLPELVLGRWKEINVDPYYCNDFIYFRQNSFTVKNACDDPTDDALPKSISWKIMEQVLILSDSNQYHGAQIKLLRNDSLILVQHRQEYLFLKDES